MSLEEIKDSGQDIYGLNDVQWDNTDPYLDTVKTMYSTYKKKNHDYGNSYEDSLDDEGLAAARIALGNKWRRFKHLSTENAESLVDESLEDTLMDMANYAIMTVMWIKKKQNDLLSDEESGTVPEF